MQVFVGIKDSSENDGYSILCFQFDWWRYFSKLTEGLGNQTFSDSEAVFVESPSFLKKLVMLLNSAKVTKG